jgi:uncharacterized protein (UPF0332 family)
LTKKGLSLPQEKTKKAQTDALLKNTKKSGIGTQNEKSLHRTLKLLYAASPESVEVPKEGFICDAIGKTGEVIEIQTGSFGPLKKKLAALTKLGKVKLVHPVAFSTIVEFYNAKGMLVSKKKSPKKGSIWEIFKSFLYAPALIQLRNLTVEIALVNITEKRVADGTGSWFRKGVRVDDRLFESLEGAVTLSRTADYRCFIPFTKDEAFTVKELAKKAHIRETLAKKMLWVLTKAGFVERTGKQGNAILYKQTKTLPKRGACSN